MFTPARRKLTLPGAAGQQQPGPMQAMNAPRRMGQGQPPPQPPLAPQPSPIPPLGPGLDQSDEATMNPANIQKFLQQLMGGSHAAAKTPTY